MECIIAEQIFHSNQSLITRQVYFSYENGRVKQKGDLSKQCAMVVEKAHDSDNGTWTCQISMMDSNNNANSTSADVHVKVTGNYVYTSNLQI